jgi:hypothetical protein
MIDGGRLVLSGPIDQLVERTGVLRVEVGGRPDCVEALAAALHRRGLASRAVDAATLDVDTSTIGEDAFDAVRDTIADMSLRLYSLSSRHRSLDDLFLQEARHP